MNVPLDFNDIWNDECYPTENPILEDRHKDIFHQIKKQLDRIEQRFEAFEVNVFKRLSRLEDADRMQRAPMRRPLAELNRQEAPPSTFRKPTSNDDNLAIQGILNNPKYTTGVQLGMAIAKILFSEHKMATCTLTGRTVNGQGREALDPSKLHLIEDMIQRRFNLSIPDLAAVRSAFRVSLMNRCKYLKLKLAPQNPNII